MSRLSTEQRQDMIIDEAINIIHNGGYQSLSIRELAKQVKISEPAIYRHFLNKEDIILGILNRMFDFDHLLNKDIESITSSKNKIKLFILFHFQFLENNREMTSVLFAEDMFNQSEILRNRFFFMIEKRKSLLLKILEEAEDKGEILAIDIKELLSIILGTIRVIVLEWRLSNFNFSLLERGNNTIKTLDKLIFVK